MRSSADLDEKSNKFDQLTLCLSRPKKAPMSDRHDDD